MESADSVKSPKKLSAIILAAGLSRRMGDENKLLLPYKDSSLIQETIRQLSLTKNIYEIIVVLGHEAKILNDHIKSQDLQRVFNPDFETGQTTSIQVGVRAAEVSSQGFMICLGDMPFLQSEDYDALISFWNQSERGKIIRPIVNDKPGHPVIFDAIYRTDILKETYTEGCRTVIQKHKQHLIHYATDYGHYLIDIDTPEDKAKLA